MSVPKGLAIARFVILWNKGDIMERDCFNKHLNINARVRAGNARDFTAFKNITRLDTLIKKCCGRNPKLNLRSLDLNNALMEEWQKTLILNAYGCEISIDWALKRLKNGGVR